MARGLSLLIASSLQAVSARPGLDEQTLGRKRNVAAKGYQVPSPIVRRAVGNNHDQWRPRAPQPVERYQMTPSSTVDQLAEKTARSTPVEPEKHHERPLMMVRLTCVGQGGGSPLEAHLRLTPQRAVFPFQSRRTPWSPSVCGLPPDVDLSGDSNLTGGR